MSENYVGITIRSEVLAADSIAIDLETLKKIAVAATKCYSQQSGEQTGFPTLEKRLPFRPDFQEYRLKTETDLRINISLSTENFAPFNCWMEVASPNSKKWSLIKDIAYNLSSKFPTISFNVNSSFCFDSNCAEDEKYTLRFKNGVIVERLTRKQWIETYLQ